MSRPVAAGSQVRDYLFVGDLVEGIIGAMESDSVGVFQLGAGYPTHDAPQPIERDEVPNHLLDN